jgi:hypothetical protein
MPTTEQSEPPRTPTTTRKGRYGQVAGKIRSSEQVPAPDDWYPLFPNPVVAESLLDRLINNRHQLLMNGASYRPHKRPGRVAAQATTTTS